MSLAQTDPRIKMHFLGAEVRPDTRLRREKSIMHNFQVNHMLESDGYVISTGGTLAMTMKNR